MKTVVITGSSSGIGAELVKMLVVKGFRVVMACRELEKSQEVANACIDVNSNSEKPIVLPIDLSSLQSIRSFVEKFKELKLPINILLNNAGTLTHKLDVTETGLERTFATNYVGTYLLTRELLPLISENGIIINTLSVMAQITAVDKNIFETPSEKNYKRFTQYGKSKTALRYFTYELAKRVAGGVTVCGIDPGIVNTKIIRMQKWYDPLADIFFRPFIKSPKTAAKIT
ncbi:MAG: SDR family NAD(P)-dependent oxidoreductase, partial [Bacteroidales bacterium]|nr:SDR family NAD(P)-dependent oxidoreductase [Bacteroidales bacterium]